MNKSISKALGISRVSLKARQIEITDIRGVSKVHVYRFYKDGHVTYNQRIGGHMFYNRFQRVNSNSGYAEYLKVARTLLKTA
jgi:hypothetical protein